jgi:hypothetical protein
MNVVDMLLISFGQISLYSESEKSTDGKIADRIISELIQYFIILFKVLKGI